jgi:hypothetical protein
MPDSGKVFPLGGVPLVRTAVWVDRSIDPDIFVADRYGFRNPDNVWDMDNIRLAAVGDSFTFGAESSTENSFVGRLRAHEPATINMGRGGNGPLAELATIREYLRAKKPQTVLWFYYQNDLQQDLFWELNTPVISEYLDPEFSQDLVSRSGAVGSALRQEYERKVGQPETAIALPDESLDRGWLQSLRFFTGANPLNRIDGLTLRRTRTVLGLVRGGGDWPDPPQAEMTEILDEAAAVTAEWGGRLLFVYLPGWREVINHDTSKEGFRTAALGAARDAQIPILDLFDVFVEHQDPKSLWPDRRPGHYGQDGNALVAVEVERWLRELGLWQ